MFRQNIGRNRALFATSAEISRLEELASKGSLSESEALFVAFGEDVLFRNQFLDPKVLAVGIGYDLDTGVITYEVLRYDGRDIDGPVNRDVYQLMPGNEGAARVMKLRAREIESHHAYSLPERFSGFILSSPHP